MVVGASVVGCINPVDDGSSPVGVGTSPVHTDPDGQHAILSAASREQTVSGWQHAPHAPSMPQELYPSGQPFCLLANSSTSCGSAVWKGEMSSDLASWRMGAMYINSDGRILSDLERPSAPSCRPWESISQAVNKK